MADDAASRFVSCNSSISGIRGTITAPMDLCQPRGTARMFRLPATITRRSSGMHQPWFPPELQHSPRANMRANLYHLRMIERQDREAHFEKFRSVDPDNRDQAIGYGHLIDETGLTWKRIPLGRGYVDLPEEYRDKLWEHYAFTPTIVFWLAKTGQVSETGQAKPSDHPELLGFDFKTIFADWRHRSS